MDVAEYYDNEGKPLEGLPQTLELEGREVEGIEFVPKSKETFVAWLENILSLVEKRGIEENSLIIQCVNGMVEATQETDDFKSYLPTGEMTVFLHWRWERENA